MSMIKNTVKNEKKKTVHNNSLVAIYLLSLEDIFIQIYTLYQFMYTCFMS